MRVLFLGDIVGRPGREVVTKRLPKLIEKWKLDFVAINGENSAGGFGITEAIYEELVDAGADAITLGNHSWDQREALVFIERAPKLIRPVNYPGKAPGRGAALLDARNGKRVLVINAMGRVFMDQLDDPFRAVEREIVACPLGEGCDVALCDFHAEATSEKQAFAHHFDGRFSLIVGTHTHAPTSDHRVLTGGPAFVPDTGMCGDYASVLGMNRAEPIRRFLTKIPSGRFEPATGEGTLSGVAVEIGADGHAEWIAPVRLGGVLEEARPVFWS